ncbi:MAG: tyrosine-protein phosphatase [Pseudomonas sp.]|nr:tyrosine-protein phosphatase [Pseudomonas sp.]
MPESVQLRLHGADNVRSLKGMPALCGRHIAGHSLLRGDQLHRLTGDDWQTLQQLGLKTVCDLRSTSERVRYPSVLPAGAMQHLHLEVTGDVRADPRVAAMLAANPVGQGAREMMLEVYRSLPDLLAPRLAALFGVFASGQSPVLIHCAAGKDRTGVAVALLLHALGVAPEVIMADYLLSARRFQQLDEQRQMAMTSAITHMVGQPVNEAAMDAVLDARPEYLQAAYARIEAGYGGLQAYLLRFSGLDAAGLQRWRDGVLATGATSPA